MDTRVTEVQLARIQTGQDLDFVPREVSDLIMFIANHEGLGEMLDGREIRVLDDDCSLEAAPRMFVKTPAEHIAEFGPRKECGAGRMGGDKALAILFDKGHEVGPLLFGQFDLTQTEEEDGIEMVEIFIGDRSPVESDRLFGDEL